MTMGCGASGGRSRDGKLCQAEFFRLYGRMNVNLE